MSPAGSFHDQLRAPNVDGERERVAASDRGLVLWSLGVSGLLVVLLRALLPTGMSDDGVLYRSLADDPFENQLILESTNVFHAVFGMRLLVPLVVWALPVDPDLGFHLTAAGGLVAGAVVVSVLARKLGLGGLALLAGPVYVASFHGIYGMWQIYHVDTVTMALFGGGVLAAYTQRAVLCSVLSAFVVASKEIGLVLPLAWWASRRGEGRERRAILETLAVAALPVALFLVMRYTIVLPHQPWRAWEQYKLGFTTQGEWGYARPLVQVLLQNHGMLWLLWPLGLLVAPSRWRRMHLFVLLLLPLLAGGPWARSSAYLAPFVLPSALLVLSRLSLPRAALALAASAAVAVPLALRNSAVEEAGSNLLLLPGIVVFCIAAFPAARSVLRADAPPPRPARAA